MTVLQFVEVMLQISADPDIGINYYWTVSNDDITLGNDLAIQTTATVSGAFRQEGCCSEILFILPGLSGYYRV